MMLLTLTEGLRPRLMHSEPGRLAVVTAFSLMLAAALGSLWFCLPGDIRLMADMRAATRLANNAHPYNPYNSKINFANSNIIDKFAAQKPTNNCYKDNKPLRLAARQHT